MLRQRSNDVIRFGSLFARDAAGGVMARFAGRRVATAYSTRVAIRAACDLLGLKPGDEVLVPAYNCGSEIDPLLHAGLVLQMYPVDARAVVEAAEVEARVTARTRAIYVTHYFGFPQPCVAALREICDRRGLVLLEDCALLMPAAETGRFGDVAFFCFYKFFAVLAGGALVLNRDDLVLPGFTKAPPLRLAVKALLRAGIVTVLGPGGVARLRRRKATVSRAETFPDMPGGYYFDPALIGRRISKLADWPLRGFDVAAVIAARRANYVAYLELVRGMAGVEPLYPVLPEGVGPLNMPVWVANRDAVAQALAAQGIAAVPWWAGYHRGLDFTEFSEARQLKDGILALPVDQGMDAAQVARVVQWLAAVLAKA